MLPRAAIRSLRPGQSLLRPVPFQGSVRTYAKAGKPRATYKPPSHSASSIVDRKNVPSPPKVSSNAQGTSDAGSTRDARPVQPEPASQEKLDAEAIDALPSRAESRSNTVGLGAQAQPYNSGGPSLKDDFETERHTRPQNEELLDPASEARGEEGPKIPLHDLTKGLPSTLDAELEQASRKQSEADAEEQGGPRTSSSGSGDRPVRDYTTSAEKRRNRLMAYFAASLGLLALATPVYLGRNWETEVEERQHPNAPNGWGIILFLNRLRARLTSTLDHYTEPAFQKLLPEPEPRTPYYRPYTLVLSLEDLLVHNEWTREHGWRMAKRPGVDYFLRYLSNYYEIVIFTSVPSMIGGPALNKLEPFGIVLFRLFREATRYENGEYIKVRPLPVPSLSCPQQCPTNHFSIQDLSYLNRPLSKTISIDTNPAHTSAQPENAIILPRWDGDPKDKELIALIPFLEYTAGIFTEDTRPVLASFKGKHIPTEFARREAESRKRFNEQMALERKGRPKRSGIGVLGSSLGISADKGLMQLPPGELSLTEALDRGLMLHDQIRERGKRAWEAMEKDIKENEADWMRLIKEDEEKMKEEGMRQMKQGFFGWFGMGGGDKKEVEIKKEEGKK